MVTRIVRNKNISVWIIRKLKSVTKLGMGHEENGSHCRGIARNLNAKKFRVISIETYCWSSISIRQWNLLIIETFAPVMETTHCRHDVCRETWCHELTSVRSIHSTVALSFSCHARDPRQTYDQCSAFSDEQRSKWHEKGSRTFHFTILSTFLLLPRPKIMKVGHVTPSRPVNRKSP